MLMRIKRGLGVSAVILVAALSVATIVRAADWPMYRGLDHTGISKETGWFDASAGVKIVWEKKIGKGFGTIAIGAGRAYAMGSDGAKDTVFCLDAKTGAKVWSFSYAAKLEPKLHEGGPSATPTIDGENVYTISKHGDVYCFSADKGKVQWTRKIKSKKPSWGFSGSPLVSGDLLILNAGATGTALNKKTGRIVWSSGPGASGYATPVPSIQICGLNGRSFAQLRSRHFAPPCQPAWITFQQKCSQHRSNSIRSPAKP